MMNPDSAFVWFVDFDGVICTTRANMALGRFDDPVAFGLLGRILRDTDALMVVSSTRRGRADMGTPNNCLDMLARYDLTSRLHPDWRTGDLSSRSREIADWLSRNGHRPYGILDDERCDFTAEQLHRLIHTDMEFGLNPRDVGRARRLAGTGTHIDLAHADRDDAPFQAPRLTISNQAHAALSALDEGDDESARRLLSIIAGHPLAQ
ncbi:HAD domain-containing protein [Sphingomonas sp. 3-13AW]|uniref:HAD domain-containing protein n=1 Tax=Sphingomonas sp. 3-13AW TaxID=3050450 RepID=UPI003BB66302